jgi:nitrogen PTS system EIIA component
MELIDLISPEGVISTLRVANKKRALQELAERAEALTGVPWREIFDALIERERLGSTGIGNGIAIPHAKLPALDRLWGVFARLETPIEFDSIDEQPVDLVFLLLAPIGAGADHLKALARVSRLLRNHTVCEKLRGSHDDSAIFSLLTEPFATHAA